MIIKKDKNKDRVERHARVRKKISGTAERPRLCVYRSLTSIYAQIINDDKGVTLASASSRDADLKAKVKGKNKVEVAKIVGQAIGERAKAKKVKTVVFDRGGYVYTGRVKALADGAREAGLKF